MMGWIVRMIGGGLHGASMHRQPSAIALASAFGLAIALMPKDNLFAFGLVAAACFVRMNHLLALVIVLVVTFGNPLSEGVPLTDRVTSGAGKWILELTLLQSVWMKLAQWPIMPWFRWNNSVVIGSIFIGMVSFVPAYAVCTFVWRLFAKSTSQSQLDAIVDEMNEYQVQIKADQNKRQLLKSTIESNSDRRRTMKKRENQRHRIDETPVSELTKPNIVVPRPDPAMSMISPEMPSAASSAVLHETVIEIVRYRPKPLSHTIHEDDFHPSPRDLSKPASPMNTHATETAESSMQSTRDVAKAQENVSLAPDEAPTADMHLLPMDQASSAEKPREEALRYLLWHLSGMHRQSRTQETVS